MAERLDSFTFRRGPAGDAMPWDEWLDGTIWSLTRGDDFGATPANFVINARNQAKRRGRKLHVAVREGTVILQAYTPNGNGA